MPYFPYAFEARVERFGVGKTRKIWYTVVFLPQEVEREMAPKTPARFRVEAEVNEQPHRGAFIPAGDGRRYLILSPKLLKTAKTRVGEMVEVRFRIEDPNRVDLPAELSKALARRADLKEAWAQLPPGRQRGVSHFLSSAKTPATRARRLADAAEVILHHRGDFRRWQQLKKATPVRVPRSAKKRG